MGNALISFLERELPLIVGRDLYAKLNKLSNEEVVAYLWIIDEKLID